MVLTVEIQWKQQVFLSTSKVPSSGRRQEPDDVVPAVTNHRLLEATFTQGRPRRQVFRKGGQAALGARGNRVGFP